jgi:hypothetical protein
MNQQREERMKEFDLYASVDKKRVNGVGDSFNTFA